MARTRKAAKPTQDAADAVDLTPLGVWQRFATRWAIHAPMSVSTGLCEKRLRLLEGAEHHALRRGSRHATPSNSAASAATIRAAGSGTAALVSEAVTGVVPLSLITRL